MTNSKSKTKQVIITRDNRLELMIIGISLLFFLLLSVFLVSLSFKDYSLWHNTSKGIKTKATIINAHSSNISGGRGGSTFSFKVTYEYFVDGVKFTNDKYSVNGKTWQQLKTLQKALTNKDQVNCYVAKSNNQLALLDTSLSNQTLMFWILMPLPFFLITALLLFRLCKLRKNTFFMKCTG